MSWWKGLEDAKFFSSHFFFLQPQAFIVGGSKYFCFWLQWVTREWFNLLPLTAQGLDKICEASALRRYTAGSTETRWGQRKGEPCDCPACGPKAASGLESREEREELTVRLGGGTGIDSWLRWVLEPPEPWNCRGEGGREEEKGDRKSSLEFSWVLIYVHTGIR